MDISRAELLDAYRRMRLIRRFEEKLQELVLSGRLAGFLHLYAGQEAVAVGVCRNLRECDWVASNHRGHGHCIARGVDVRGMMAELFGRATGVCKGKGGSMQIRRTGGVAVAFFGDGATNQGQFHEALNMAANWKLPAVFVAENNGYGEFTPTEFVVPVRDIADRATSYAMRSEIADGNDLFDVTEKAARAVAHAREGGGPTLLECKTYRWFGHYVGDPMHYRTKEEAEEWIQTKDPLQRFEQRVVEAGLAAAGDLRAIDGEIEDELAVAVAEAEAAPLPEPSEVTSDVYVRER
jgi:pyruvate dehydrogenase E1 component alpha subunit